MTVRSRTVAEQRRQAQRDEWLAKCDDAIRDYAAYVNGKTVALVGPAASTLGRKQGAFIDSHDIIVRLNLGCPVPPNKADDLGTRTDVLYHVLFDPRIHRSKEHRHSPGQVWAWRAAGVRFLCTRQDPEHSRVTRFRPKLGDILPLVTMPSEFQKPFRAHLGTNPNTGTLAIVHLLAAGARSVWVTGFDFYQSGYHVGYGGFDAKRAALGTGGANWGLDKHKVPHSQEPQMQFLADLARHVPQLHFDDIAAERLGLIPPPPGVTALVPMKGHSERVPGKNVRDLCGRPLLFWTLDTLHKARRVSKVVVDTDSDEIANLVTELHPSTVILRRPARLRGDMVTGNPLTEWEMTQVDGEHFLQTHVTNPLLTPQTVDAAVEKYFASETHDSLFAVTEHHFRLFTANGRPVNHDPAVLTRSQDLEPLYEDNSNLYIFSRDSFARAGGRIGLRPQMFPMSKLEAVDIDYEDDFLLAEAVMRAR